ncbi:UdgX family uracil-DNA binding protein [Pelagicoccus albus]|uniref:Type-4 uracil-DNA glycosylase n=1 Tax=Pelagicoccus albus TaxID=415222 RepID=A0A7X1B2R9_9BACT|nr:UdgX family uracil-DNA binding protein [Pelagicoccus albus]MBC2604583.1 UdgX family uracil-DNA binding protein [Pelagicoccus albus]
MEIPQSQIRDFDSWREAARDFLQRSVPPERILWGSAREELLDLGFSKTSIQSVDTGNQHQVPAEFLNRAKLVACHFANDTWDLLYRLLWRIAVFGETQILRKQSDPEVASFTLKEKAVRRERHKMTAFVRFRKVADPELERETYVAWYEPEHDVVRLASSYFRDRFASMNWSIITPRTCVHWDGTRLRFSEADSNNRLPEEDELEAYWKKYYASTFNPARLNIRMMEKEMPRRYWKNLPEADLIAELSSASYGRTKSMTEQTLAPALSSRNKKRPRGAPDGRELNVCRSSDEVKLLTVKSSFDEAAEHAATCQACPLYQKSTQTVWGSGPKNARLMIVGEQPGDQEDLSGQPFVGPAGQLLHEFLQRANLSTDQSYLTNAVKHFSWRFSKGRRLHQKPSSQQVHACRPWLEWELRSVRPEIVLCLGTTAARSILGKPVSPVSDRGLYDDIGRPFRVIVTYHPSYLLRLPLGPEREARSTEFLEDIRLARIFIGESGKREQSSSQKKEPQDDLEAP